MTKAPSDARLNDPVTEYARQDYVRVFVDQTIGEALAHIQGGDVGGRIVYFYVVDHENHLHGVLPTRRLLLNPPETPIREAMVEQVVALPATATLLDACDLFLFHRLLALPVVDDEWRLLGIVDVEVYTEEISDLAYHKESDDVFQLIGVHVAQVRQASVPVVFRKRFPWLMCNIAGGLACALIAGVYQDILDQVVALALFIPVVLALAESVSIQSLTLTLQAQHGRRFRRSVALAALGRETPVGLLLGLGCGAIVGLVVWTWQGLPLTALCVLLAIFLSVTTAAVFGMAVPTILRAVQRDPKVASGPLTLALTDLATMFYYLGIASKLLG